MTCTYYLNGPKTDCRGNEDVTTFFLIRQRHVIQYELILCFKYILFGKSPTLYLWLTSFCICGSPHLVFVAHLTFLFFFLSYFTPKLQLRGYIGLGVLESTTKN